MSEHKMGITFKEFETLVARPLKSKVDEAVRVVEKALSLSKHHAAIAFSGGKDSTVLVHLVHQYFLLLQEEWRMGSWIYLLPERSK